VLVLGESGSGKELVARDLHRFGPHPAGPFVAINCAALPESLVESELFGHERGAFTGALAVRKGAFESADRGTLLLDELGELPLPAQAKLLRVLEERTVSRLGGTKAIAVEARVVAATNRDLEAEIAAGRFREDLYFRLNVHVLRVPPLRDRLSDVPALADLFLTGTCARFGIRKKKIAPEALELLMRYEWRRNNVRELRNMVERMIIAAEGDMITAEVVPAEIRGSAGSTAAEAGTFHELKSEAERRIILTALERHDWHVTRTAEALGLADHASLLKIMRRHNIRRPGPAVS
jgi:two-component system nitrogen regulation response regulator NtrX